MKVRSLNKILAFLFFMLSIVNISYTKENIDPLRYDSLTGELRVEKFVFDKNEDIWVYFTIKETETKPEAVELKISEKYYFNFSFLIKSVKNKMISEQDNILSKKRLARKQPSGVNYKVVTLAKDQFYGQRINLSEYYNFKNETGLFIIKGIFTPVPFDKRQSAEISSRVIQIEIRDQQASDSESFNDENENEFKAPTTPYDTVSEMLKAWKNNEWELYYKYMDLEDLIKQYPKMYERYIDLRPSRRAPIISDFKEYLKEEYSKEGLSDFEHVIYKSVVENERNQAKIYVKIKYKGDLKFYKKYVYNLKRVQGKWFIYRWQYENYP